MKDGNVIEQKSIDFAIRIVNLYKILTKKNHEYVMSTQILRSGTSIGANITESKQAQSRADFLSKVNISLKEACETEYWLKILFKTEYILEPQYNSLNNDCLEIIKILTSIIKSIKQGQENG